MTTREFNDAFTTMLNSYNSQIPFGEQNSNRDIVLDEYEKSLFLTKAQEELVVSTYNGKNRYNDYFESSEETRRYLDTLLKTKIYTPDDAIEEIGISDDSIFFELPEDLAFITLEQIIYNDDRLGCYNGERVNVIPIKQDEYNKIKNNSFRGVTKYKALRLDYADKVVEVISKYNIDKYIVKYISKPEPIILVDLPNGLSIDGISTVNECKLNPLLHNDILDNAFRLALMSKNIRTNQQGN